MGHSTLLWKTKVCSQEIIFPAFCAGYDKYQMYFCAYIYTQIYTQERERDRQREICLLFYFLVIPLSLTLELTKLPIKIPLCRVCHNVTARSNVLGIHLSNSTLPTCLSLPCGLVSAYSGLLTYCLLFFNSVFSIRISSMTTKCCL